STANGNIKPGDALTYSATPGVAVKATSAGYILGHAEETYSGSGQGSIQVRLQPTWYDPNAFISSSDAYSLTDTVGDGSEYKVTDTTTGATVTQVGQFSSAIVGNFTAGHISAQRIDASTLNLSNSFTIGGQSFPTYLNNQLSTL